MRADVLVVGAGPAGSALARQLAGTGLDVVVVDRAAFPRDKPCGEFLSPQCQPLLEDLGLGDLLAGLGAHRVDAMHLHHGRRAAHGGFRAIDGTRAPAHGFGVRRAAFDHALLRAAERAGARFLARQELVALVRDANGRVCGASLRAVGEPGTAPVRTIHARYVVGADGVRSRTAAALGVQRQTRWLDQVALVAHFDGVAPRGNAEVHLLRGGFFAATSVEDGSFGVNLVLPRRRLRERGPASSWDAFVAGYLEAAPSFAERLRGARRRAPWRGCGPFAFHTRTQTVPGAALVGDAAGYVDPLTGEGIYFALFGAASLGRALRAAFDRSASEAKVMADYRRERARELGPRLGTARLLQRGLRSPTVVRGVVSLLRRWPGLCDLVVTLSGDTVHPRQLWRPSFWRAFAEARA